MKYYEVLKYLREKSSYSRPKLASLIGISPKTIESYEYGTVVNVPTSYINYILKLSGYSNVLASTIQYSEKITVEEIEESKLCQFSHSLNILSLFSDKDIHLIGMYMERYKNAAYDIFTISEVTHNFKIRHEKYTQAPESVKKELYHDGVQFLCQLNIFKPSEFGITIEDCLKIGMGNEWLQCLAKLEQEGCLLTKENIEERKLFSFTSEIKEHAKSFGSHLTLEKPISKELQQIIDAWEFAPKPVQQKILKTLEKYKAQASELDDL